MHDHLNVCLGRRSTSNEDDTEVEVRLGLSHQGLFFSLFYYYSVAKGRSSGYG